jgi:glycerol-3-phosphate dehydrogenase
VTREAVVHYCTKEWARHLDDVMLRRSGWHYYITNRAEVAKLVCSWMAEILNWDSAREQIELERYSSSQA